MPANPLAARGLQPASLYVIFDYKNSRLPAALTLAADAAAFARAVPSMKRAASCVCANVLPNAVKCRLCKTGEVKPRQKRSSGFDPATRSCRAGQGYVEHGCIQVLCSDGLLAFFGFFFCHRIDTLQIQTIIKIINILLRYSRLYLCLILFSSIYKTMLSTYVFYKLIAVYSTYHIATISCC